jgi:hypothetical protein
MSDILVIDPQTSTGILAQQHTASTNIRQIVDCSNMKQSHRIRHHAFSFLLGLGFSTVRAA